MPSDTLAFADLPELSDLLLKLDKTRLRIASRSMVPTLRPGDEIVVEPVPIEALRTGDLILFRHQGLLICHRLVEVSEHSGTLLARGDATSSAGQQIAPDQVVGKVVNIRKRTVWAVLKATLQQVLIPPLLRSLSRLQRLKTYRVLMRPILAPTLSYHLGLAQGGRWYDWQELRTDKVFPALPRSQHPHLLIAKRGNAIVGWSRLVVRNSEWQCEDFSIRMRYRGLDLESNLARVAHLIVKAQ